MLRSPLATAALTLAALLGFAANSLLCRLALAPRLLDAASFTSVRLASGALALALLVRGRAAPGANSAVSALALFAYAAAFSFAYLRIGAAAGALLLFGAVQLTMLLSALGAGERPRPGEWLGLALASAGLVALLLPGLSAPDPGGAALMVAAGIAWGLYSLRGRGSVAPLATTAANFAGSVVPALALSLVSLGKLHVTAAGVALAATSGAATSGLAYSLWYAALPALGATRAALVQLAVPVITALGAVLLLGEALTPRLVACGSVVLGGIAVALRTRRR